MLQNNIDSFVLDSSRFTFVKKEPIGKGSHANVYLVEDENKKQFAAKILNSDINEIDHKEEKNFIRELSILGKVNNPCTIGMEGFTFSPKFLQDENCQKKKSMDLQ